jgi:NADH dehydrogenase/NADH:ubiquinone oxidoreductase subunit G
MTTEQFIKGSHYFTVEVYKGLVNFEGRVEFNNRVYRKIVETKSFSIVVTDSFVDDMGNQKIQTEYFMDVTARAGEFKYAIRKMQETCRNLKDIRSLMIDLRKPFLTAIKRDAAKAVRRFYRLYDDFPSYDITSSSARMESLPQGYRK